MNAWILKSKSYNFSEKMQLFIIQSHSVSGYNHYLADLKCQPIIFLGQGPAKEQ